MNVLPPASKELMKPQSTTLEIALSRPEASHLIIRKEFEELVRMGDRIYQSRLAVSHWLVDQQTNSNRV